jgi:hypothetical protein
MKLGDLLDVSACPPHRIDAGLAGFSLEAEGAGGRGLDAQQAGCNFLLHQNSTEWFICQQQSNEVENIYYAPTCGAGGWSADRQASHPLRGHS